MCCARFSGNHSIKGSGGQGEEGGVGIRYPGDTAWLPTGLCILEILQSHRATLLFSVEAKLGFACSWTPVFRFCGRVNKWPLRMNEH